MKNLTLSNLGDGMLEDIFQRELKKTMDDIADEKSDWSADRKITLEISIGSDSEREIGYVSITGKTKLPGYPSKKTVLAFEPDGNGSLMASPSNMIQGELFDMQNKKRSGAKL